MSNEVVRLNVGGKLFTTLKDTLLASEDSYFTGLLSGKFEVPFIVSYSESIYNNKHN